MPQKPLPSSPNLDHFKHQARDLQKAIANREPQAAQRIREFHVRYGDASDDQIFGSDFRLSDAQLTIAREYGLPSWTKLRACAGIDRTVDPSVPRHEQVADPLFREAVDRMDAGNEAALRELLTGHPRLVHEHVEFPVTDYFGSPSLLEFVAENPVRRGSLPPNIVQVAKVILDAGAKEDFPALNRALSLVASGCVPRECNVQIGLIDLLCDYGADPNAALPAALVHGEFAAVEELLRRGAAIDLATAAATKRSQEFLSLVPGASPSERRRALAYASQFGNVEIVHALLDAGEDPSRYNPVGCHSHSTPLHQAALAGHLAVVRLLIERGADPSIKDTLFHGTPLGWAEHGGQAIVAEFLRGVLGG